MDFYVSLVGDLIICTYKNKLTKDLPAPDTLTEGTDHDEFTAASRALHECCFVTIYREICPTIMKNRQAAESRPAAACFTLKSLSV